MANEITSQLIALAAIAKQPGSAAPFDRSALGNPIVKIRSRRIRSDVTNRLIERGDIEMRYHPTMDGHLYIILTRQGWDRLQDQLGKTQLSL